MKLLAIDTATEALAVAVAAGGRSLVRDAPGGAAASATLLPVAQALLAEAGLALAGLDAIAFGRGPGAFTGLRTSCAVAQGLAFGLGRPVLPIDSLLIVAEDARAQLGTGEQDGPIDIGVAMDARMDEIYAGRWCWQGGAWRQLEAPRLTRPAALAADWARSAPAVVAGSALPAFGERLPLPAATRRVPAEQARAAALLRLARAAWLAGAGRDAAQALPLYLRDKVAQTTAERERARVLEQARVLEPARAAAAPPAAAPDA